MKTDYELLCKQLSALTEGVADRISNLANAAAVLYQALEDVNWAGFYILDGDALSLGPFMGRPACVRIPLGKGVCGSAALRRETLVVADVHRFPGHIACDAASRSEIVVPLIADGALYGVLDIDSPSEARFSEADRQGLEAFARTLERALAPDAAHPGRDPEAPAPEIRRRSELAVWYAGTHPIRPDAPEVRMMERLCAGDAEGVCALFSRTKQFGDALCAVDTPYGRFEGLSEIRRFASEWNARFGAERSSPLPCIQTIGGGRAALEVSVSFVRGGAVDQVPMFVIADYRAPDKLDEVRIYVPYGMIPGHTPYRKPMFPAERLSPGDPALLTGAVREYYEALHTYPAADVERILNAMSDDIVLGGYQYYDPAAHVPDGELPKERVRRAFEKMRGYIPSGVAMRYETVIDDGRTAVLEWVHIVSQRGRKEFGRIAMSGIAAYERGDDGHLCSVRILDYAWKEPEIDWSKTPVTKEEAERINLLPD